MNRLSISVQSESRDNLELKLDTLWRLSEFARFQMTSQRIPSLVGISLLLTHTPSGSQYYANFQYQTYGWDLYFHRYLNGRIERELDFEHEVVALLIELSVLFVREIQLMSLDHNTIALYNDTIATWQIMPLNEAHNRMAGTFFKAEADQTEVVVNNLSSEEAIIRKECIRYLGDNTRIHSPLPGSGLSPRQMIGYKLNQPNIFPPRIQGIRWGELISLVPANIQLVGSNPNCPRIQFVIWHNQ